LRGQLRNPNFHNKEKDLKFSLNKYAYLSIEERIERIGEILALAVRLFLRNKILNEKNDGKQKVKYLEELA